MLILIYLILLYCFYFFYNILITYYLNIHKCYSVNRTQHIISFHFPYCVFFFDICENISSVLRSIREYTHS